MKTRTRAAKPHRTESQLTKLQRENRELKALVQRQANKIDRLEKELAEEKAVRKRYQAQYYNLKETSTAEIGLLQVRVKELEDKLAGVMSTLAWHQKQAFGERSEKTPTADIVETKERKPRGKREGALGYGRKSRDGLLTDENYLDVSEQDRTCRCCGKPYRKLPKGDRSEMIELVQELIKIVDIGVKYVKDCGCDEGSKKRFVSSAPPPRVFPRALLGPDLWADILTEKFLFQKPLTRISKKYGLLGAEVPVSTICSGMKKIAPLLFDLYEEIQMHAKGAEQWNMDETTWRVFSSDEQKHKNNWWLWVVTTSDCWVYLLDPSRSKKVPTEFFQGTSEGVLITDRYSAYKSLSGIQKAYCWAHVRRDFIKISEGVPELATWADSWVLDINELYRINNERVALLSGDRVAEVETSKLKLKLKISEIELKIEKGLREARAERQKKVLRSLKKHWQGLTIFVEQPNVPMDNNAAERALRHSVCGRKNYYGSGSEESGHFAAAIFTICQTWLCNQLDPISLLQDFLRRTAEKRGKPPPIEDFLHWKMNVERREQFKLKRTK